LSRLGCAGVLSQTATEASNNNSGV